MGLRPSLSSGPGNVAAGEQWSKPDYVDVRPKPKPKPKPPSGCDPNYSGGCVPIASDVDCAGGNGNGPAYFSGTAIVVGEDIYGLDADNDGVACE